MVPSRWLSIGLLLTAMFPAVISVTSDADAANNKASFFTPEQHVAYDRDGYLVVSNIFSETDLKRLMEAGDAMVAAAAKNNNTFSVMAKGALFQNNHPAEAKAGEGDDEEEEPSSGGSSCNATTSNDMTNTNNAFRQIAVHSVLGQASAELLQLNATVENLRILRDVFLAKPVHASQECDWHVDDQGFWPESFCSDTKIITTTTKMTTSDDDDYDDDDDARSEHKDTQQEHQTVCANGASGRGVNVWIAMDDMPIATLGSMALSPGSHKAPWRHDAYRAIGQDRSIPGGFLDREEVVNLFTSPDKSTCNMPKSDPALRSKIEDTAVFLDIRAGDVIFAHRLLFHRTLAVTDAGKEMYDSENKTNLNRYSIRYVPGVARLPTGYTLEWSTIQNPANRGRTLNEVASTTGQDWYPEVWPTIEADLDVKLDDMASGEMVGAKEKAGAEMQEIGKAAKARREQQE